MRAPLPAVLWVASVAAAGMVHGRALNDTGLTRCVDAAGLWTTACAGTGHDAATGRDARAAGGHDGVFGFSFVRVCHGGQRAGQGACPARPDFGRGANQWGCTLDAVTGLLWEVKTSDTGLRDRRRLYTNQLPGHPAHGTAGDASGYVNAVNAAGLCGANDWQLPTRVQLQSLVFYAAERASPLIDPDYFPKSVNWYHWTSTARGSDGLQAMFIAFDTGGIFGGQRGYAYPVRLVRGAPTVPPARYALSADGQEVTDLGTRLVWRRCVEGMFWDGSVCAGEPEALDWEPALANAVAQGPVWRMPNVKELSSLLDERLDGARIDPVMFPATPAGPHWSSSISGNDRDYCWTVNFADGHATIVTQENWDRQRRVRLVRDLDRAPAPRPMALPPAALSR